MATAIPCASLRVSRFSMARADCLAPCLRGDNGRAAAAGNRAEPWPGAFFSILGPSSTDPRKVGHSCL